MPNIESDVVVIGGGVAGLAAAGELARKGITVSMIEARDRLGGRILTVRPKGWKTAVELGAEFIHEGNAPQWRIIRGRGLHVQRIPPRHWLFGADGLKRIDDIADRIGRVTGKIHPRKIGTKSFAEFLRQQRNKLSHDDVELATSFVEGFEAAPTARMSARAVAGATLNDAKQFLMPGGYDGLVQAMVRALPKKRVQVFRRTVVRVVEWQPHDVTIRAGGKIFTARAVVIALPLGVLQASPPARGAVVFTPALRTKARLVGKMGMGQVVRLIVRFDARRWKSLLPPPIRQGAGNRFGFLHSRVPGMPVWWALRGNGIVTGWAGGPAASALVGRPKAGLLDQALSSLGRLLDVSKAALRGALRAWETHDWSRDPFSRGAYSFSVAGQDDAPAKLRQPIADTLFFTGEATADGEEIGTVHGALASGIRAAREATAALGRKKGRRSGRP